MTGRVSAVVLGIVAAWLGAALPGMAAVSGSAVDPAVCPAGAVALRDPRGGTEVNCAKCPEGMATVVKAERNGLTCVARDRTEPGVGLGWRVEPPASSVSAGERTVRRG